MFLSYFDSSGRPDYSDQEDFVLASVTVNEHQWYYARKKIEQIKTKYFPDIQSDRIEFHAKDMINHSGIYKKLSWEEIYSILDDIFEFITSEETHLCIIAAIIKKQKLKPEIDIETWVISLYLSVSINILKSEMKC